MFKPSGFHGDDYEEFRLLGCDVLLLLVTANVPSTQILVTLMTEAKRSSETSVLTSDTQNNIPEDDMLHMQCYLGDILDNLLVSNQNV
jgi:hypothetical protein